MWLRHRPSQSHGIGINLIGLFGMSRRKQIRRPGNQGALIHAFWHIEKRNHVHITRRPILKVLHILHEAAVQPLKASNDSGGMQGRAIAQETFENIDTLCRGGKPVQKLLKGDRVRRTVQSIPGLRGMDGRQYTQVGPFGKTHRKRLCSELNPKFKNNWEATWSRHHYTRASKPRSIFNPIFKLLQAIANLINRPSKKTASHINRFLTVRSQHIIYFLSMRR